MADRADGVAATASPLLSAARAADYLGISRRTLWTLTNAKSIPHLRIGNRIKYRIESLNQWLADQERKAARR